MKVKTLFISDIHLGTSKCQAPKLLEVLKDYEFENLIIVGDFIDLTSLKRKFYWNAEHSKVIQKILKISRKSKVIYILGNHDFYLRSLISEENINLGDILICDEYIYETIKGERIYICHGDQFDGFIRMHPFIYILGDWAYEMSFKINKIYNFFRRRVFGLTYWSLSQYLKSKVKNAISFINDFKILSIKKLKETDCDSIMIGHIHTPAIEKIEGDGYYYNVGDFCESCSFLYESYDGSIELVIIKDN
jgi:UDP-2,3-diacylglucosamine pyrophosphatase LpxH